MLECSIEDHRVELKTIELEKKGTKAQDNHKAHHCYIHEGDLVLVYDKDHDLLGHKMFDALWIGPYINTLYLRKLYPQNFPLKHMYILIYSCI